MVEEAGEYGWVEIIIYALAIIAGLLIIYWVYKSGWVSMSNGIARIKEWVHMA